MRKAQRHYIAIAIAILLSASLSSVAIGQTSITFWHFLAAGSELDALSIMIEEFESLHPDIKINTEYISWGNPYYEKLIVSVIGGSPPDVAMMHATKIAEFAEADVLFELTAEELEDANINPNDYFPIPWQASTYEGTVLALPFDIHPIGLFINPGVLQEAGLPNIAPDTSEELFAMARTMNRDVDGDGTLDTVGFGVRNDGFTFYRMWYSMLQQNGVNIINEAATGLNEDTFLTTALETLKEASELQAMVVGVGPAEFINHQVGIFLDGTWQIGGFIRQGVTFDAAPFPVFGENPAVWTDSHLIVLPRPAQMDEKRLQASKTFAKWMTQNNAAWAEYGGHVSPNRTVLQSREFQSLQHQLAYAHMLDYVAYFPQVIDAWELQDVISSNLHSSIVGGVMPTQAIETMKTAFASVLKDDD